MADADTAMAIGVRLALDVDVVASRPVGGGCISAACQVTLADGRRVFAKSGDGLPAGLLEAEATGLRWLADAGPHAVKVPCVLGRSESPAVLVLEWIDVGREQPDSAERLGRGLAHLHAAGAPSFGAARDGFIGSLPQRNTPTGDAWPEFWLTHRIEPLARQALARGSLARQAGSLVVRLGERLAGLGGPAEPPARVHGDLWSGNVLVDTRGLPWVVDPAAYGGHREVDLAMLHLFGSPGAAFVDAYQAVSPLADGWRDRVTLWQLEPLLVHAILFGGSYGTQAHTVLRRFT